MAWYNAFWDNVCDAADNCGEMFSMAGESFANGNIMGGLHQGFLGVCSSAGNVITLGGANALGNAIYDSSVSGEADKHDNIIDGIGDGITHCVEWVAKNEAESMLIQDDLSKGVYNEYVWNDEGKYYEIDKDANGNLKSYEAKTPEELKEFDKLANTMGAVDVAFDVVDVATAGTGSKAIKSVVKPAGTIVIKEGVIDNAVKQSAKHQIKHQVRRGLKMSSKGLVKEAISETTEGVIDSTAKQSVKQVVKEAAKEGTENIVEDAIESTAKQSVKQTIKVASKEGTEEVVKDGIKVSVKEGGEVVVQNVASKSALNKAKVVGKTIAKDAGILIVGNRVGSGKTVSDIAMNGGSYAATDIVKDTVNLTTDVAEDVAGGAAATCLGVWDNWLSKHPVIGRFVNTCRSAYYASTKSFTNNKVGALSVAAISKPLDKVKSFISSSSEKYEGMSINEIANQFKEESTKENKKWKDHYVERVKELDAKLGLDSSTRCLVASEDSVSSDAELGAT